MNCPKCNVELRTSKIGDVQIDECATCKGIWFDEDELRQAKDQTDKDLNWMDFDLWKNVLKSKVDHHSPHCPKCSEKMNTMKYGKTGIEIDYCTTCQGTWLDGGEFEKIIDELTQELLTKSSLQYFKATLHEAKEIFTGKEGLISEWKDFQTVLRFFRLRAHIERIK
jgi:Zn-finger nucleic acid-binding protein